MISRTFPDVLTAWHGLIKELSYERTLPYPDGQSLHWGVCVAYPDILEVRIDDACLDNKLHLGMSSYTKSRWTRFLRRYLRPDFQGWIRQSLEHLSKYPSRGFVSSYSINLNPESKKIGVGAHGGHKYGGCLSSIQVRICPQPRVILYSRACQLDKIGFLDLCLIHLVAKEMEKFLKKPVIRATWVVSLPFISAVSQVFYTKKFKKPLKGHILERRIKAALGRDISEVTYGPLKRLLKRIDQLDKLGHIPGSCPVKNLSLEFKEVK